MPQDKEVSALATLVAVLEPFDGPTRRRMVTWANERLDVEQREAEREARRAKARAQRESVAQGGGEHAEAEG